MASLKDAETAREQMAESLRRLGAHAISVEEEPGEVADDELPGGGAPRDDISGRGRRRRRRFAVVAWFAVEPPEAFPARIEVRAGTRATMVPLRARRDEPFRAE